VERKSQDWQAGAQFLFISGYGKEWEYFQIPKARNIMSLTVAEGKINYVDRSKSATFAEGWFDSQFGLSLHSPLRAHIVHISF
jgi:hypothetical protein